MSKTVAVTFHTSEEMKRWLLENAQSEKRSLTGQVNYILEQAKESENGR